MDNFFRADFAFVGVGQDQDIVDFSIENVFAHRINAHLHLENVRLHARVDGVDAQWITIDRNEHGAGRQTRRIHISTLADDVRHLQTVDQRAVQLFAARIFHLRIPGMVDTPALAQVIGIFEEAHCEAGGICRA